MPRAQQISRIRRCQPVGTRPENCQRDTQDGFSVKARAVARTPPKAVMTREAGVLDGLFIAQQNIDLHITLQIDEACAPMRSMQCNCGMSIDTAWFTNRLAERHMSQRQLAKLMGVDAAAVSLMLRGKRRMTVEEASQIAVLLQSTTTDVLTAAGVTITGGERVRVAGILQAGGVVHLVADGLHDTVEAPPSLPVPSIAIQARTQDVHDGWLYFLGEEHGKPEAAIGKLALVAIRDNGLELAHVRRGYRPGAFNLIDPSGQGTRTAELAWASPVVWIRAGI